MATIFDNGTTVVLISYWLIELCMFCYLITNALCRTAQLAIRGLNSITVEQASLYELKSCMSLARLSVLSPLTGLVQQLTCAVSRLSKDEKSPTFIGLLNCKFQWCQFKKINGMIKQLSMYWFVYLFVYL